MRKHFTMIDLIITLTVVSAIAAFTGNAVVDTIENVDRSIDIIESNSINQQELLDLLDDEQYEEYDSIVEELGISELTEDDLENLVTLQIEEMAMLADVDPEELDLIMQDVEKSVTEIMDKYEKGEYSNN